MFGYRGLPKRSKHREIPRSPCARVNIGDLVLRLLWVTSYILRVYIKCSLLPAQLMFRKFQRRPSNVHHVNRAKQQRLAVSKTFHCRKGHSVTKPPTRLPPGLCGSACDSVASKETIHNLEPKQSGGVPDVFLCRFSDVLCCPSWVPAEGLGRRIRDSCATRGMMGFRAAFSSLQHVLSNVGSPYFSLQSYVTF